MLEYWNFESESENLWRVSNQSPKYFFTTKKLIGKRCKDLSTCNNIYFFVTLLLFSDCLHLHFFSFLLLLSSYFYPSPFRCANIHQQYQQITIITINRTTSIITIYRTTFISKYTSTIRTTISVTSKQCPKTKQTIK